MSTLSQRMRFFANFGLFFTLLSGTLAVLFLMYIGTFTRYWADDFCFAVTLETAPNIFVAVWNSYSVWSNRYTNILLAGLLTMFGRGSILYAPALMIGLMAAASFLAIEQANQLFKSHLSRLTSAVLAVLLVFFTILQAPNRFQAVYWLAGLVTYFAPLIFWAVMAFLAFRGIQIQVTLPENRWVLAALAFLAFLAGGLSETTLTFQLTAFGLAILAAWFFWRGPQRRSALWIFGIALAFSLLALLVVFFAPGNAVRLSAMPKTTLSLDLFLLSFRFTWDFIANSLQDLALPSLVSFLLAFFLALIGGTRQPARFTAHFWLGIGSILLVTYLLIASMIAPSVYVYGRFGYPEARALFPARFVLTLALMLAGLSFGHFGRSFPLLWRTSTQSLAIICVIFLAVYPLRFIPKEYPALLQAQRYAQDWDKRNAYLLEQENQSVVLDGIESPGGLAELKSDSTFWINRCVADFYHIHSIAVFP